MRIDGKSPIGAQVPAAPRRTAGGAFSLGEAPAARSAQGPSQASNLGGIEALLVLQAEHDPLARKRKVAKRGRDMLASLDRLKAGLLNGRIGTGELLGLKQQLAERRDATDDPGLDDVLAQIELRAEVELAKLARRS
ncbi:hypothetical protein GCM10007036_34330 [Alsobacter metallidurans]|uniref:Flagellar assembly protein FliX n=1 Tax=Alsobacter metallidurans TaxID=340221 RepID=A0A917I9L3_9HYPH|nr:flagellar assembly protein FliX [Alsobacter metallidurans]GGH26496.1 hypothetical protein GCM10007036_34330 [Alsobacter metallidurans]